MTRCGQSSWRRHARRSALMVTAAAVLLAGGIGTAGKRRLPSHEGPLIERMPAHERARIQSVRESGKNDGGHIEALLAKEQRFATLEDAVERAADYLREPPVVASSVSRTATMLGSLGNDVALMRVLLELRGLNERAFTGTLTADDVKRRLKLLRYIREPGNRSWLREVLRGKGVFEPVPGESVGEARVRARLNSFHQGLSVKVHDVDDLIATTDVLLLKEAKALARRVDDLNDSEIRRLTRYLEYFRKNSTAVKRSVSVDRPGMPQMRPADLEALRRSRAF